MCACIFSIAGIAENNDEYRKPRSASWIGESRKKRKTPMQRLINNCNFMESVLLGKRYAAHTRARARHVNRRNSNRRKSVQRCRFAGEKRERCARFENTNSPIRVSRMTCRARTIVIRFAGERPATASVAENRKERRNNRTLIDSVKPDEGVEGGGRPRARVQTPRYIRL